MTPGPLSLSGRRRERAAGERIAELFEEHGRMVYGVCRLMLRDPTEAEDAAQQTFLSAYRSLLGGQEPRQPSAWLATIARNECRGRLRSRKSEPLTLVTAASVDETQREVARHEEIEALSAALAELPQQQRDAIVLREFYGLSYSEVAAALGVSGAAVESLLFRSRRRLQEHLRPLRAALGALALPPTLSESLARALPGFGGGGAGAGAVAVAKVGAAPLAAKLAALTLAVGAVGTVAGVETTTRQRGHQKPSRPATRQAAVVPSASEKPLAAARPLVATRSRRVGHRHSDAASNGGRQHSEDSSPVAEPRETEPEHEQTRETMTETEQTSTNEAEHEGSGGSDDGKNDDHGSGSDDGHHGGGDDTGDSSGQGSGGDD
ncbi:MAG TPA: sigma-70 family RNA polymerase sigma factor [Gaiellaceae bacterium]|nr:sigma-70 family RNA polymerase sigma factor [Gaiellaceae bacterium]